MADFLTVSVDEEEIGITQFDTDDERVEKLCDFCREHEYDPAVLIVNLALECFREKFTSQIKQPEEVLTLEQAVIRSIVMTGHYHVMKGHKYRELGSADPERLEIYLDK